MVLRDTSTSSIVTPCIVGRSSSHFTRVVRLFAHECGVPHELHVVSDLLALDASAFGGNPGLKLPNLVTSEGVVFGALNSCRALVAAASRPVVVVWPEDVRSLVAVNAQELTLQAMTTEVTLILTSAGVDVNVPYAGKLRTALNGMLQWLDAHVDEARNSLPTREISYFEAALFSLLGHLEFRNVVPTEPYVRLRAFADDWGQREAARLTPFRFD